MTSTTKSSPWGHPVCSTCGGFLPDSCVCPPSAPVKVQAGGAPGAHTFVIHYSANDFTDVLDYQQAWRWLLAWGFRNCPAILARAINSPDGWATA